METSSRPGREILLLLLLGGLLAGWFWYASQQDAEEGEHAAAYEGLLKESIQAMSEGAEKLKAVKDPARDQAGPEIDSAIRGRVEALLSQQQATPVALARKVELDRHYRKDLEAAWDRWSREHTRIFRARDAATREALEKGMKGLRERLLPGAKGAGG